VPHIFNFRVASIKYERVKTRFAPCVACLAVAIVLSIATCTAHASTKDDLALYTADELSAIYGHSPLGRLPPDPTNRVAEDPNAAALGQFLFFDSRFSANGAISCATCHNPALAFTDGRALSKGIAVGTRNVPTVLDVAFSQWFFLDGRTDSLWSQAIQPFENAAEIGGDRLQMVLMTIRDPALRTAYQQVFGSLPALTADLPSAVHHARPDADPQSPVAQAWRNISPADRRAVDEIFSNLGKAIEAFERRLLGGPAPFDSYVAGLRSHDPSLQQAISPAAKRGLELFVGAGRCELCHSGPAFTDGQFHNLGLPLLPGQAADPGRAEGIRRLHRDPFNGVGHFSDASGASDAKNRLSFLPDPASQLGAFKTPTLRNVALTAPYMHDGRFTTLEQVLDFYGQDELANRDHLVGVRERTVDLVPRLTGSQRADLVEFLRTLTSPPLPSALTHAPAHP
jgi:cytochrome c peroxidase